MASELVSSQLIYWVDHWFILSSRSLVHALAGALRKIRMAEEILVIPFRSLHIRVSSVKYHTPWDSQDTSVGPVGATDSTFSLSEVEIRVHEGIGVDEPSIDVVNRVVHMDVGATDDPGKSVVQDGIGHGLEIPCIVDQPDVWVEFAVTLHVCALDID
jgi:hypothetical protein